MLTKGEISVLEMMANNPDEELVECIPGGWYFDLDRIDGRIGWSLLREVLISEIDGSDEKFRRYYINETGRKVLAFQQSVQATSARVAQNPKPRRRRTCA